MCLSIPNISFLFLLSVNFSLLKSLLCFGPQLLSKYVFFSALLMLNGCFDHWVFKWMQFMLTAEGYLILI